MIPLIRMDSTHLHPGDVFYGDVMGCGIHWNPGSAWFVTPGEPLIAPSCFEALSLGTHAQSPVQQSLL